MAFFKDVRQKYIEEHKNDNPEKDYTKIANEGSVHDPKSLPVKEDEQND